jgi:hypothetical protein
MVAHTDSLKLVMGNELRRVVLVHRML